MDESFVHKWHSSPYPFFESGCEFIGHLTGNNTGFIITHAITKGPLVALEDGYPVAEGRFGQNSTDMENYFYGQSASRNHVLRRVTIMPQWTMTCSCND